jgi:hypothetical protein
MPVLLKHALEFPLYPVEFRGGEQPDRGRLATDRHPLRADPARAGTRGQIGVLNPRWIEFVEAVPKTARGKIQPFKLR